MAFLWGIGSSQQGAQVIKLGGSVPLNLQLYDGNEEMTVEVEVIAPQQDVLFTGTLTHVKNGLYENLEFKMPSLDYVIATYIVYDGKDESEQYERATDLFYRDKTQEIVDEAVTQSAKDVMEHAKEVAKLGTFLVGDQISETTDGFLEGVEDV